jgi:HAD superfamily hydrolase (TIGR01484 family)
LAKAMKPLLCFDVDGTLLDERDRIHPRDASILAGIGRGEDFPAWLIPATGRSLISVKRTFARLGLYAGLPLPLPLVLQNGAALYLPGEQLVSYTTFNPGVQDAILVICQRHPQVTFLLHSRDAIHMLWPHPYGIEAAQRYDFDVTPFDPETPAPPYSKMMCLSRTPADLAAVSRDAQALAIEQAYSMASILEFSPAGMNKGEGLARLRAVLGSEDAPVLAAGDGGNDLALFEQASLRFTPATSPPAVQARGDRVIDVGAEGLLRPMLRAAGVSVKD